MEDGSETPTVVKEYNVGKLLGSTLSRKGKLFGDQRKQNLRKMQMLALNVLTLARRTSKPAYFGARLWPVIGISASLTNFEVMDASKDYVNKMERIQNRLGRMLLRLPPTTPNVVVQGELGWWPIQNLLDKRKLMYLRYILDCEEQEPERLIVQAVRQQVEWHRIAPQKQTWYSEVLTLVQKYDIELTGNERLQYFTDAMLKQLFKRKVQTDYTTNLQTHRSLEFYRDKRRPHLDTDVGSTSDAQWWMKCRTGTLQLGWKQGEPCCGTCREEGTSETIQHFLWECSGNRTQETKETVISTVESYMPDFVNEGDAKTKTFWLLAQHQTEGMRMWAGEMVKALWTERTKILERYSGLVYFVMG